MTEQLRYLCNKLNCNFVWHLNLNQQLHINSIQHIPAKLLTKVIIDTILPHMYFICICVGECACACVCVCEVGLNNVTRDKCVQV